MNTGIVYIVFGVSGSGKTTIGESLANDLTIPFYDADDFHPKANINKMSQGIPLDDNDRGPWLQKLAQEIINWNAHKGAVLACSALKKEYRKKLQSIDKQYIRWIFLDGSYDLISSRIEARKDHFFKKEMLTSQFETLEKPEDAIVINVDNSCKALIKEIKSKLHMNTSQLGLIGLGVMGKGLANNILSKNIKLSVFNRQVKGTEVDIAKKFVQEQQLNDSILGFDNLQLFVDSLAQPRTIMIMVNAGKAVDMVIDALLPMLSKDDCLIDGGNSHYKDTLQREKDLKQFGIHFLGAGISGGEKGALKGPSIMPGGSKKGYDISGIFLETIAAKDKSGNPCCTYLGPEGSGHYIKMVHNGIEYAEMQLLAETYHLLRFYVKKTPIEISDIFSNWIENGLKSYLLEITVEILKKKEGDHFLIDKILDKAGQKGTGGWSTNAALEIGMSLSTISESVMARNISAMKSQRVAASEIYQLETSDISKNTFIKNLEKAFQATSIVNHHIGFELLQEASKEYNWHLNLFEVARVWTNGCIIKSDLMEEICDLLYKDTATSLLMLPEIVTVMKSNISALSEVVSTGLKSGCAIPVFSAAANYFIGYTSAQSSANMIQAQRDYFGAHTYQRVDKPNDQYFHTNWK
ncbi:NADP-dependent phosphogluconate dehydrogenase [Aquimarina sp. 2201CG14-23]|uniref:NADP-dependent phosphogluconate dehydrogenase n=1 Tax=Aquimarina mycalae TaxID=3040073 RepID=UPI002477FF73|nr:NADP-dependent phosphogluconate dehydrogenase [Aquimarina sp. 2201CG14-23]MDH7445659.1 NADP-dependent phosphogluconate dehydrogenase [Aquimarina sp. 2201CG14-23]